MFQIGDNIVYPMHGAGIIEAIEEKEFLEEKQQYYVI
ncbi:CarD family transcriptional regulator, partial [Staphylococcus aureus]